MTEKDIKYNHENFYEWLMNAYDAARDIHFAELDLGESDEECRNKFIEYVENSNPDQYELIHYTRFLGTSALFGEYFSSQKLQRFVELGGTSVVGKFLTKCYKKDVEVYENDLREKFSLKSESYDCVLCLEVMEHIKDSPSLERSIDDIASFKFSGMMNLIQESHRILRPNGLLLVSTPNGASLDVMVKTAIGESNFLFDPHVRELTPFQLVALANVADFEIAKFGTIFAWTSATPEQRDLALEFIQNLGADPRHRGDDALYAFRKTGP